MPLPGCPSPTNSLVNSIVALTALILLIAVPAPAHDFAFTEATLLIQRDGAYRIDLRVDVDALALGVSPTTDSVEVVAELQAMTPEELARAVENARQTVLRRVRLRFDGVKQRPEISFPEQGTELALENELPTLLGLTARLSGRIPAESEAITFGASRAFKTVHLTLLDQRTGQSSRQILGVGQDSAPYPLRGGGFVEGMGQGRVQLPDSGVRAHSSRRCGPHSVRAGPVSAGAAVSTAPLAGDRLHPGPLGNPGPVEL